MIRFFKTLAIVLSFFIGSVAFAQLTEPGGGDGGAPSDGGIAGGGAPVGGGSILLIGMGVAYASRKTFLFKQDDRV